MGAEAKRYLQEHSIPQLFESLMTGLIYNKPEDPIDFLDGCIRTLRHNPDLALKWDSFVDTENGPVGPRESTAAGGTHKKVKSKTTTSKKGEPPSKTNHSSRERNASTKHRTRSSNKDSPIASAGSGEMVPSHQRVPSVTKAADVAQIAQDAPIILFMGGPGGGKTKYAAKIRDALEDKGLVHICMPDLVKNAVAKYKDRYPEWRDAAEKYQRGELIPNHLAQDLVKAEMGRYPYAKAYFLEGFPREARQVEDFERNVRPVNMALILDYDEDTLRKHMQNRGLSPEVIDRRIHEFKQKTLPSAKYFDDQRLLHLIPGEKDDQTIFERMRKLVLRAIELGVPITNSHPPSAGETPIEQTSPPVINVRNSASSKTPNGTKPPTAQSNRSNGSGKSIKSENRMNVPTIGSAIPPTPHSGQSPASSRTPTASSAHAHVKSPDEPNAMENGHAGNGHSTPTPPKTPLGSVSQSQETGSGQNSPAPSASRSRPPTNASRGSRASVKSGQKTPSITSKEEGQLSKQNSVHQEEATPRASPEAAIEEHKETHEESTNHVSTNAFDLFPKGLPANAPVILIIGAPGSHKSNIAEMVSKKYDGFIHLSMGALLRRKVLENPEDELWMRVGQKMNVGDVVPTKICREILYTSLHDVGSQSWGYVIEGYPRTLEQAQEFEDQLGRLDLALLVDCTEQFCKDSLAKRVRDARDSGETERADDDPKIVKARLEIFKQNTLPMLKYLDDKGKLRVVRIRHSEIEGDSTLDKVFSDATNAIDNTIFIEDDGNGNSLENSQNHMNGD